MCFFRHATLPVRFPLRISRVRIGHCHIGPTTVPAVDFDFARATVIPVAYRRTVRSSSTAWTAPPRRARMANASDHRGKRVQRPPSFNIYRWLVVRRQIEGLRRIPRNASEVIRTRRKTPSFMPERSYTVREYMSTVPYDTIQSGESSRRGRRLCSSVQRNFGRSTVSACMGRRAGLRAFLCKKAS